jgi:hypothetical protein
VADESDVPTAQRAATAMRRKTAGSLMAMGFGDPRRRCAQLQNPHAASVLQRDYMRA